MATLREIKRRITGVRSTSKITQAMKMVSAAKLRRAQDAIWSARPYVSKLEEVISNLVASVGENYSNPVIRQTSDVKSIGIIVVGSDRGLCGSFNANLFRTVANYAGNDIPKDFPGASVTFIPVGKRSCQYFRKHENFNIIKQFPDVFNELRFKTAQDIITPFKYGFIEGKFDRVEIWFNEFINILKQVPKKVTVLPIEAKSRENVEEEKKINVDYIYEPGQPEILDVLLPKLIDIQVWRSLLESSAAEQAARMMAMDNATNNAKELIRHLEIVYNRERQAAITKEMLEIVSGADALTK